MSKSPQATTTRYIHSGPWLARLGLPVMLLLSLSTQATELVINGSFEQQANNAPSGWQIRGTAQGAKGIVDTATASSGTHSLRISGRSNSIDGPQQSIKTTLTAAGTGKRFGFRFRIRTDDVASVRALLKFGDDTGPRIDAILAEAVITQPNKWTLVEGSFPIHWQGTLQSAAIVFEVFQITRQTGALPGRLVPAYYLDEVSMDLDSDGDYLFDRDEPALGFNPAMADTDNDSLPDRWELDHGFSPASNESQTDSDQDGFTNRQEFFAATDPRNASQYPGKPANPKANSATREVLQWLALLPSVTTSGHLVVGQMVNDLGTPTEYQNLIEELATATGKYPALLQLAVEPPFDKPGIPLQIAQAEALALPYWQNGGLVMLKWAMYNPWVTLGPGTNTSVDLAALLDPALSTSANLVMNQAAHDRILAWMSTVADTIERLGQQGVVVMFRPISEMNGGWFWWGMREKPEFVALWRYLYQYFTNTRGLNNMIWVYESDSGTHAPSVVGGPSFSSDYYYPGDDYVDVISHNLYNATWDLSFDSNELYSRYPKVYGIPQAGPDHANRDGNFDNLIYLTQSEARLPRSSFFSVWNSFTGNTNNRQNVAIVDNRNASALMNSVAILSRDELTNLLTPAVIPDTATPAQDSPNILPVVSINDVSRTLSDTDNMAGEILAINGSATDSDGTIASLQWLLDGAVVGTGPSVVLHLADGVSSLTLRAIDDDQAISSATLTFKVAVPAQLERIASYNQTSGLSPQGAFSIGMVTSTSGSYVTEAGMAESVSVVGMLYPEQADIDSIADIFVVALTPTGWFMRNTDGNFVSWDSHLSALVPYREGLQLDDNLALELYNGTHAMSGQYKYYLGYMRSGQAELVYTYKAGTFTIK